MRCFVREKRFAPALKWKDLKISHASMNGDELHKKFFIYQDINEILHRINSGFYSFSYFFLSF